MKTYTESEVQELLRQEQQNVLNIISEQFLKSENYKQATFHDKVLFRALGETIPNFPLPLPILPEKEETELSGKSESIGQLGDDVTSVRQDSIPVVSHSCTSGNSIEPFIRMKINAAHRNLDKAQKTSKRLYFSAKLKAFHEVLDFVLNSDKNDAVSDTGNDHSSNVSDNPIISVDWEGLEKELNDWNDGEQRQNIYHSSIKRPILKQSIKSS